MAFNQVAKYYRGYLSSVGNTGGVIAGLIGLSLKGSTSLASACTDYSGNIYVTDPIKHIVLKITESGNVINLAGLSGTSGNNGSTTVTCVNARFNHPTGIACGKNGDLYVCDTGNHQIRKISNNSVSLVAGAPTPTSGTADGTAARFNSPYGIDIDNSGVIYVADTGNHAVRVIRGGVVSTIAGSQGVVGNAPVWSQMTTAQGINGTDARFNSPYALAVDASGYVFVCDSNNHVIKRIDPAGRVRIFSGTGTYGRHTGISKSSTYQDLRYIDVNRSQEIYVMDYNEAGPSRVVMIDREGTSHSVIDWNGTATGQYASSVVCNPAGHLIVVESDYETYEYSSSSSTEVRSSSSSSSTWLKSSSSSISSTSSSSSTAVKSSSSSSSKSTGSSSSGSSSSSSHPGA